jgi:hypothetical protein
MARRESPASKRGFFYARRPLILRLKEIFPMPFNRLVLILLTAIAAAGATIWIGNLLLERTATSLWESMVFIMPAALVILICTRLLLGPRGK